MHRSAVAAAESTSSSRLVPLILSLLVLLFQLRPADAQIQNNGTALTNRYWDCCKPSCGWKNKADVANPVRSCDRDSKPLDDDFATGTGCNGGYAFACTDQTPWAVNDTFAYGFAGAFLKGGQERNWCCTCFQLTFRDEALAGKTFVIQVTNTDYDVLTDNMFTFALPGGNNSNTAGCPAQFSTSPDIFGQGPFGLSSQNGCDELPEQLQAGCNFRFDWLQNVERPEVNYQRITCPTALTDRTGCTRADDTVFGTASPNAAPASRPRTAAGFAGLSVLCAATAWLLV